MNCKQVRKFYDPTLEIPGRWMEHIEGCQACQTSINELRRLHSMLKSDPPVALPPDFDLQVQRRVRQWRRNPLHWWRLVDLRYALPIAAMVLAAVTTLLVVNRPYEMLNVGPAEPGTGMAPPVEHHDRLALASNNRAAESPKQDAATEEVTPPPESESSAVQTRRAGQVATPPTVELGGGQQVILRIFDESNQYERLVTIPSTLYGAKPVFASMRASEREVENVY